MEKHLDQTEIDSMFAAVRSDAATELVPPSQSAKAPLPAMPYNFSRAGQISKDQMQAISTVNDLFARNLTHNLGAWLRASFDVTLVSAEQMMYSEFTALLPELAYLCSVTLNPLDAIGAVQFDLALAAPIVDLLLGGPGRPGEVREPTDIEDAILVSVMDVVVRELNLAWQTVGLAFALERRESDAQIGGLMPSSEKTLCVSFEVHMAGVQGSLNLCLPSVVLNTILRRLTAERERPKRRSGDTRARLRQLMAASKFDAALQFPPMRLNAHELANLAPGKVLRLPLAAQSPAELRVAGQPIFHAMPVRLGERRGAQIKALQPCALSIVAD
jgi:flagellar motor switch protein FliM